MPLTLTWSDIALRLVLTVASGVLLGFNRSQRGRPAGLCTTILVCLAASVSMILANLLLATSGKTTESFVTLDPLRLPLGIFTGMGFIGAGAIVRRGELVHGVTTAATLWFATAMSLCFGSGQHMVGGAALALALGALWGLKRLELQMHLQLHATLLVRTVAEGPTEAELRAAVLDAGYRLESWDVVYSDVEGVRRRTVRCKVAWHGREHQAFEPAFVAQLAWRPGVLKVLWKT